MFLKKEYNIGSDNEDEGMVIMVEFQHGGDRLDASCVADGVAVC